MNDVPAARQREPGSARRRHRFFRDQRAPGAESFRSSCSSPPSLEVRMAGCGSVLHSFRFISEIRFGARGGSGRVLRRSVIGGECKGAFPGLYSKRTDTKSRALATRSSNKATCAVRLIASAKQPDQPLPPLSVISRPLLHATHVLRTANHVHHRRQLARSAQQPDEPQGDRLRNRLLCDLVRTLQGTSPSCSTLNDGGIRAYTVLSVGHRTGFPEAGGTICRSSPGPSLSFSFHRRRRLPG